MKADEFLTGQIREKATRLWKTDRREIIDRLEKIYNSFLDPKLYRDVRYLTAQQILTALENFISNEDLDKQAPGVGERYYQLALREIVQESGKNA